MLRYAVASSLEQRFEFPAFGQSVTHPTWSVRISGVRKRLQVPQIGEARYRTRQE
jgi:hypothetical protein